MISTIETNLIFFIKQYVPWNHYERDKTIRNLTVIGLSIGYLIQCVFVQIIFLLNPQESRYLSSYILSPYYDKEDLNYIALAGGFIFEWWIFTTQWTGLILQVYINLLYLQTMSASLRGLRYEIF